MQIERLEISHVRNLSAVRLPNLAKINVFFGDNGSGKSSLLESVHVLGLGRSFRTRQFKSVIQHDQDESVVFCSAYESKNDAPIPVGVSRSRRAAPVIRIQGKPAVSLAELAKLFPLQLINSDTFSILQGSPSVRRQFLDWGVFHVEHRFHAAWLAAKRCLKHRNSLLRHGKIHSEEMSVWSCEFAAAADLVDQYRQAYISRFVRVFAPIVVELTQMESFCMEYRRGWPESVGLTGALSECLVRDAAHGHTSLGPHKADLKISLDGSLASECLSRGQEKLLISALKLAQAAVFEQITQKKCIFLIDDMPAELDDRHRKILCQFLENLDCQVFVTCVDKSDLDQKWRFPERVKWFHVEHGQIKQV